MRRFIQIVERANCILAYHGSREYFSHFDFSIGRTAAAFFTDSTEAAAGYGQVRAAYLEMDNPFLADFRGRYWNDYWGENPKPAENQYAIFSARGEFVKEKGYFDTDWEAEENLSPGEYVEGAGEVVETTNTLAELARTEGHDGCIFSNVRDNTDEQDFDKPHTVYVVFSPEQIRWA